MSEFGGLWKHQKEKETPSMLCRLGSATLSQLAFPGEDNPNFPWEKSHWDYTAVKKKKKVKVKLKYLLPRILPFYFCLCGSFNFIFLMLFKLFVCVDRHSMLKGLHEEAFESSGFSAEGTSISASAASHLTMGSLGQRSCVYWRRL